MKAYSFYQFMKTKVDENSSIGELADHIKNDSMFPKYSRDYHEISEYLERNPYAGISLVVFDDAFEKFQNWLDH